MYLSPASRILDLGTGNGRNALYLAQLGHNVSAVDIRSEYITEARNYAQSLGSLALGVRFGVADITTTVYPENSFDAVFVTRVLQETPSKRAALGVIQTAQTAVKPRGLNFITAYVGDEYQKAVKPHLVIFSPDELPTQYRSANWELVRHNQCLRPLQQFNGGTLLNSHDEFVAKKP
jgi:tellurite methyltransferase